MKTEKQLLSSRKGKQEDGNNRGVSAPISPPASPLLRWSMW